MPSFQTSLKLFTSGSPLHCLRMRLFRTGSKRLEQNNGRKEIAQPIGWVGVPQGDSGVVVSTGNRMGCLAGGEKPGMKKPDC